MGEEAARDCSCRSWEEQMYWTHFQCLHFSQILHAGFDRKLAIPEHFTKNLRKKLPKRITLKGPSGNTWQVGLTTYVDTVYLISGWQEFVHDNSLHEKDLLVFKYNGDSCFDVLIFDGQNLCEKVASYFVRKCGRKEPGSGCLSKRKIGESSAERTFPYPEDIAGGSPPEKSANNDFDTTPLVQSNSDYYTTPLVQSNNDYYTTPFVQSNAFPISAKKSRREIEFNPLFEDEPSTSAEEIDIKPDFELLSRDVVHDVPYISRRRPVTEEEKQNALQLAQSVVTSEGFIVVMKPTHVSRRFYMSIPSGWMAKHLSSLDKQDMILRMKENTWITKFYYQRSRNSGGLSAGWKNFARDNDLQEFDVLVFEPASPMNNVIVLDVNIFRVFHEDD